MQHKYECAACRYAFIAPDDYDDDPKTRNCPKCKKAEGNIIYHGCGKSWIGIIRDDLGPDGIKSQANGKMYSSRSRYYADVKAAGCEVIGTDAKVEERKELRGDYNCERELSQAMDQTGFIEKIRSKKAWK